MKRFLILSVLLSQLGGRFCGHAQTSLPAPTLVLTINNQVDLQSYPGWPLLVRLELLNEALLLAPGSTATQLVSAGALSWPNAITLNIADASGVSVAVPVHLANAPQGDLVLTSQNGGETGWWLLPEDTTNLAPGAYTVQAILNTTNSPQGWQGMATSPPVYLTISNPPPLFPADLESERLMRLADLALWQGDRTNARANVETLLSEQRSNVAALTLEADLDSLDGQSFEAFTLYNQAVNLFFQTYTNQPEPPALLLHKQTLGASQALFVIVPSYSLTASVTAPNQLTLQWAAISGQTYNVESSSDLIHWVAAAPELVATNNPQTWTTDTSQPARFFRISSPLGTNAPASSGRASATSGVIKKQPN